MSAPAIAATPPTQPISGISHTSAAMTIPTQLCASFVEAYLFHLFTVMVGFDSVVEHSVGNFAYLMVAATIIFVVNHLPLTQNEKTYYEWLILGKILRIIFAQIIIGIVWDGYAYHLNSLANCIFGGDYCENISAISGLVVLIVLIAFLAVFIKAKIYLYNQRSLAFVASGDSNLFQFLTNLPNGDYSMMITRNR